MGTNVAADVRRSIIRKTKSDPASLRRRLQLAAQAVEFRDAIVGLDHGSKGAEHG